MSIISFNKTLRLVIAAFAVVVAAPAMIFAQGETFTDCDAWSAAVCGNILDDDFESFVPFDDSRLDENGLIEDGFFGVIPIPQTTVWGELFQQNEFDEIGFFVLPEVGLDRFVSFDSTGSAGNLVFTPDADLGPLEGFCFTYIAELETVITFLAFDGDTVVASIPLPTVLDDAGAPAFATFGWQNTDGLNVTRFEFATSGAEGMSSAGFIGDGQLAFGDGCDPPEATCFEQLGDVEANLADLVDTLSGNDAYFAAGALDCVRWMQHDCFWEQPSGNRLSRYGGSLFIGAAYTILYLEWVDDPQADVLIDDLIGVLECIVDNEIAYAIANGGSQSFIDRAEDFAELGEIIDDDFDNEVVASLAYRLAWVHAYYATQ